MAGKEEGERKRKRNWLCGMEKKDKRDEEKHSIGEEDDVKEKKRKRKKQEWELTKEGNLKKFPLCATEVTVIVQSPRKNKKRRSH